jgi:hypothetical protein
MNRLQRFQRSTAVLSALVIVSAAFAAPEIRASRSASPSIAIVAAQLGVKLQSQPREDFEPGVSFTGTLEVPEKLEAFGIKGMTAGARVTATRVSLDRIVVEADQVAPAPARGTTRIMLGEDGKLRLPPRA